MLGVRRSDLRFGRWGETFSDDVVAAAMIDRLVHPAEVLTLSGDSYRTRGHRELLVKDRDQNAELRPVASATSARSTRRTDRQRYLPEVMQAGSAATTRAATTSDLEDVFELAKLMALTFVPERDAFTRTFQSVLDDPSAQLLVVDLDGRVGGYLLGFEHVAFFANGSVAWVEEIAVRAHLRRQHLGAQLMSAYEAAVRARGGRLVALATTRASHFYEALGYTNHAAYYRKILT